MSYSFIHRGGHIEVVDAMGRFVLSADTIAEAYKELAKELEASRKIEENKPPRNGEAEREHIWKRLS